MRLIPGLVAFLFSVLPCHAGTIKYPVSDIPPAMLTDADYIVRLSEVEIEYKSLNHDILSEHIVLTILKESASENAILEEYYDNDNTIKSISGYMYDFEGKLIREFKSADIYDYSAVEGGTLYSDDRVKVIKPVSAGYPFTVEYYIEHSFKRILGYPGWKPRSDFRESIQSAKLTIKASEGLFPRIKTLRLPANTIITGEGTNEESWELKNLEAMDTEPLCPDILDISPLILIAPSKYIVKGYEGDFTTWIGYGQWMLSLYDGRDTLDLKYTDSVRNSVDEEKDTVLKIKKVYQYMQKTCRYVAVNVGIGGWQPEYANNVARLGYGDCKGLVNLMKAMLKRFGIKSICALVSAGPDAGAIISDFPSNQFNHVILAVPLHNDTIWLECTNPEQKFGYLGSFTCSRKSLFLTSGGGVLVRTPSYPKEINTLKSDIRLSMDALGNADVIRTSVYRGLQFEDVEPLLALNPEHLREKAKEIYDIPGLVLNSIQLSSSSDFIPEACEILNVKVRNYASNSGIRMFIPLNRFIDEPEMVKKDTARRNELCLSYPYIDYDTISIHIPDGYVVESLPQSCNIKNQFGHLVSEMKTEGATLKLYRKLEMENGIYPASSFNDFVAFLQQVYRQDKAKVVLKH